MLDPREMPIPQALLDCVPRALVFEMTVLPIADDGQTVTLLCCTDDAEIEASNETASNSFSVEK